MRSYIRHPSDIPIEYHKDEEGSGISQESLNNVSRGGLSFSSSQALPLGTRIDIRISYIKPVFEVKGVVAWCHPEGDGFHVGVTFVDAADLFRVRMVEQICHIEQYKAQVLASEGRRLNGEQAANEWIQKFADSFPQFNLEKKP
jgi:hypothetical protein